MSIASAKLAIAADPTPAYRVIVNPFQEIVEGPNGELTSSLFVSTVQGGVGPFDYQWVRTLPIPFIEALTPTAPDTQFRASGTNFTTTNLFRLFVTDNGNGGAQTSFQIGVEFRFGDAAT